MQISQTGLEMVWNAHVQLHILVFWYVLDEHSCTFPGARVSHVCRVLLKFMSSLRPQFVSLWSTRKGCNNPKYQYSVSNRECLPQARWVSPIIFILYKREWAHSLFYTSASTKQWICTKFTKGKYVAKLLKLTGKDSKFYIYTPI